MFPTPRCRGLCIAAPFWFGALFVALSAGAIVGPALVGLASNDPGAWANRPFEVVRDGEVAFAGLGLGFEGLAGAWLALGAGVGAVMLLRLSVMKHTWARRAGLAGLVLWAGLWALNGLGLAKASETFGPSLAGWSLVLPLAAAAWILAARWSANAVPAALRLVPDSGPADGPSDTPGDDDPGAGAPRRDLSLVIRRPRDHRGVGRASRAAARESVAAA